LFVEKDGFYRLYFLINNLDVKHDFSSLELVLEIIYRGEKYKPLSLIEFWTKNDFKSHLTRDCYFLKTADAIFENNDIDIKVRIVKNQDDILFAKKLIDENLDRYTGDRLTLSELEKFSAEGLLYCAYKDGVPCGMLQAEVKNNINWLGHIVVQKDFRGLGVANHLTDFYLKQGLDLQINQFQLWVINDNSAAVRLYEKKGFKYLNKSTFSMLKIK
jgi:ribosomal protein S18 acetylase RimI-like enzyme